MKVLRWTILMLVVMVVARALGLVWGEGADWLVYQRAVSQFLAGGDLYKVVTGIPFNYPPSSILWFLAWRGLGWQAWWVASLGSLGLALYWLVGRDWWWWFLVCCLLFPVKFTLGMGQVNLMILLGYVAVWRLYKLGRGGLVGLVLGLMISIKVMPVLLIPWLILRRKWRAVLVAGMVVIALNLMVDGMSGQALINDYRMVIGDLVGMRVVSYYNQSLPALAYRWVPEMIAGVVGMGMSGLVLGVSYVVGSRDKAGLLGYVLVVVGVSMAPGIVWQHQLVWLIPAIVVAHNLIGGSKSLVVWWLGAVLGIGANMPGLGGLFGLHGAVGGMMLWLLVLWLNLRADEYYMVRRNLGRS